MNLLNWTLVGLIVGTSLLLVTSRQQQRLDHVALVKAQKESIRLEQDFQNLRTKQQQLEKTESIEKIARTQLAMERPPTGRVDYFKAPE
jgi:cell division protein FtsL